MTRDIARTELLSGALTAAAEQVLGRPVAESSKQALDRLLSQLKEEGLEALSLRRVR
jgi:hypothetical protein